MANPFLAEIRLMAFNFAPHGWATCDGQLLPINQNQALFSLLGTQFGGNGTTTFALPDLRGRTGLGAQNQGNGLSAYSVGEVTGVESVTLTTANLPAHSHPVNTTSATAVSDDPHSGTLGKPNVAARFQDLYRADKSGLANAGAIGNSTGGQPHENRQPYPVLLYAIALQGIFPPRQ